MIEHVESIHIESEIHPFRDCEVFDQRRFRDLWSRSTHTFPLANPAMTAS